MWIELLPALNGDCILVEYAPLYFILIDGGYVDTYHNYLLPRLKDIAAQGGIIDLVVVTHIDGDHISGVIKLLEEETLPIEVRGIWYNGYRHVQSVAQVAEIEETIIHRNICKECIQVTNKPVSAKQGCTLSALIARKGLSWNEPVGGRVMKGPMSIPLGDMVIHILSPDDSGLEKLNDFWKKRLIKDGLLSKVHSNEYWDDAFEFSLSQDKPGFRFHEKKVSKTYDLQKLTEEPYMPDGSVANGSSISCVLENEGKRVLFLGDAHSETIEAALKKFCEKETTPYWFDAVKLSHHGSYNNSSPELLSLIKSDKWIISTNGDKYNHPDMPTLAHVITKSTNGTLFFNYRLPICDELSKSEYHENYEFGVVFPENGDGISINV